MPIENASELPTGSSLLDHAQYHLNQLKANSTIAKQSASISRLEYVYEANLYESYLASLKDKEFIDPYACAKALLEFVGTRMALLSAPWDDNSINKLYLDIWIKNALEVYTENDLHSTDRNNMGFVDLKLLFLALNRYKNLDFQLNSVFEEISYVDNFELKAIQQRLEEKPQDIRVRHIVSAKQLPSIYKAFLDKLFLDYLNQSRDSSTSLESLESFIEVMLLFFEESFGKDKARAIVLEASLMSLALRAKYKAGREVELDENAISRIAQLLDRSALFADAKELGSKFLTRLTVDSLRLILDELEHKSPYTVKTEKSYYSDFLFLVLNDMSQNDSTCLSAELVSFITTVTVNDAKEVETQTALAAAKASPSTTAETAATTRVIQVAENAANTLEIIERVKQAGLSLDETIASKITDLEKAKDTARIVQQNNHVKKALLFIRRVCASELNVKSEVKAAVYATREVTNSAQESIQQFASLKDVMKHMDTLSAKVFLSLLELIEMPEFPFEHVSFDEGIYFNKLLPCFNSEISSQAQALAFKASLLLHEIDFMASSVAKTNIYGSPIFRDPTLEEKRRAAFEKVDPSTCLNQQPDNIKGTNISVANLAKLMFSCAPSSDSGRHKIAREIIFHHPTV